MAVKEIKDNEWNELDKNIKVNLIRSPRVPHCIQISELQETGTVSWDIQQIYELLLHGVKFRKLEEAGKIKKELFG
tara:strand:+ start:1540 stop:1767 length:228 start_codon:yes stop_codon:yes gene_type:complete